MNEYTRFHIAVRIDMTVVTAAGNAASHKFTVVLKIHYKNRFAALLSSDFAYAVVHVLTLRRIAEKLHVSTFSDRHIVEIPAESTSMVNDEVKECVACHRAVVCTRIAD